jgi:hypothetical protein
MSGVLNLEVYWIASRPSLDVFVSLVTVLVAVGSAVKALYLAELNLFDMSAEVLNQYH